MPKEHKTFHIITEAGSVFGIAPFLFYAASKQTNKFLEMGLSSL